MDEYSTFNAPDNPQNNDLLEHEAKKASNASAMVKQGGVVVQGNKQTKELTKEGKSQKKKDRKRQNRRRVKKKLNNRSKKIDGAESKLSISTLLLFKKVNDYKQLVIFKEKIKMFKKLSLIRRRMINAIFKRKNELKKIFINTKKKIFNFKNFQMQQEKNKQTQQQNSLRMNKK